MDFKKYVNKQNDIIKWKAKKVDGNFKERSKYLYTEDEQSVYICVNGHYIIKFLKAMYMLDNAKVFNDTQPLSIDIVTKSMENAEPITKTTEMRKITTNGKTFDIVKFTKGNMEIWVNENYLNEFNFLDPSSVEYRGTAPNAPISIWEYGECYGVILPIRIK